MAGPDHATTACMTIHSFTFNPFSTNCYVAVSDSKAVIVDPSCQSDSEVRAVMQAIEKEGAHVERILLTHAHIDHIFGCRRLSDHFGVGIEVHRADEPLLGQSQVQAQMFGIDIDEPPRPVAWLEPGVDVTFGNATWAVLHTPGHSPGSVSFVDSQEKLVLSGDVLFAGSIGRTDLWQGDMPTLMRSIFEQLIPLGDDFRVLSGHGPETTIGKERTTNPFLVVKRP